MSSLLEKITDLLPNRTGQVTPVPTPEMPGVDGQLYVRTLGAIDGMEAFGALEDDASDTDRTLALCAAAVCDSKGKPLGNIAVIRNVLNKMHPDVALRVIGASRKAAGLDAETEKNSDAPALDST